MKNNAYPLLIFDWDGTLMDSTLKIVRCFQAAARACDLPVPSDELIKNQIGLSLHKAWENMFAELGVTDDPEILECASLRYRDHFLGIDQTPMPLYAGVVEGVQALEDAGYMLAIATGKARRGLAHALQDSGIEANFVTSRCADEAYSKPHPKMLFDVLEFCGCEANQALMIGDTIYDMQMAQNAGMDSLAVSYGVQPDDLLRPLASEGCVPSFSALMEWLI